MLLLTLSNSQQAFSLSVFHLFQGMSRLITVISNVHISSLSVCHTLCWLPLNDHCCCRPADSKDCYDVPAQLGLFWPGLVCSALLCFSACVFSSSCCCCCCCLTIINAEAAAGADVATSHAIHVTYLPTWASIVDMFYPGTHPHIHKHTYFML